MADYGAAAASIYEIPLTKGFVAIVDAEDAEFLTSHRWHITRSGYAERNRFLGRDESGKSIFRTESMHRLIMSPPSWIMVDHINGDKLDNRRSNLRFANNSRNKANGKLYRNNKTGYKGVHETKHNSYIAVISKGDGVSGNIHLGTFKSIEEAAEAYNKAATEKWGSFAKINEVNHGS